MPAFFHQFCWNLTSGPKD